jgi:sulfite dehydrogenase (cytochrome) subunit B
MTKKIYTLLTTAGLLTTIFCSCSENPKKVVEKQPEHTFSIKGSVREMSISPAPVDFPDHEGKSEFVSYCGICHSLRYISAQPDFPRKVWEAEVTKMIIKYHAPIDSVNGKKIVDYLVAIKSGH